MWSENNIIDGVQWFEERCQWTWQWRGHKRPWSSIASGTGSGHMAMVGGVPGDDLMTQGAGESPPCDNESDIGSNASVPLEETEYFIRCKVSKKMSGGGGGGGGVWGGGSWSLPVWSWKSWTAIVCCDSLSDLPVLVNSGNEILASSVG